MDESAKLPSERRFNAKANPFEVCGSMIQNLT
jgi:hypothetical protein